MGNLRKLPVPLPLLNEQKRIVTELTLTTYQIYLINGFRAADLASCKSNIEEKHFAIAAEAFSKINEPVFCDKKASKYFYTDF